MIQDMPVDWEEIAQSTYHAYGKVTDFKNFQGNPMPEWEQLTPTIQAAWKAAAENTVRDYAALVVLEDPRQLAQVQHAIAYSNTYADAGVPGHGQFILIARLARWLGF